jgi:hypothetical protein
MSKSDPEHAPLDEPGKRSGEGSRSILPHLQRQAQTQIKVPVRRTDPDAADEGPDSQPSLS